jgi:DNA-directed RNA polymerase subunit K/omega
MEKVEFTKYERARIIGARALQISMDAPILVEFKEEELEGINYDPLKIAEKELDSGVLPISIKRPVPLTSNDDLGAIKIEESSGSDEEKIKTEQEEEKEISERGEMMELAQTGEEDIEETESGTGEGESEGSE